MRNKSWLLIALVIALLGLGAYYNFDMQWGDYGTGDWLAYWSIPRGVLFGQGYFNSDWLERTQTAVGYFRQVSEHHPLHFWPLWNPPPIVLLLMPMGAFPFTASTLVWIGLCAILFGHAALLVNRRLPHPLPDEVALGFPFLYLPFLAGMFWGQVTPLLGAFMVYAWLAQRKNHQVAAGVLLVPILLKPHLLFIAIGLLLLVALRRGQWAMILSFTGFTSLLVIIAFVLDPTWVTGWITQGSPVHWQSVSLWDLIKSARELPGWIQFTGIPIGILIGLVRYWNVREVSLRLLGEATLLSTLFNPYLWHHDILVMLPAALWIGSVLWNREMRPLMVFLCVFSLWAMPWLVFSIAFLPYMAMFIALWWWSGRPHDKQPKQEEQLTPQAS
ncbi:MAG: DUF2029 domain-containing protein [Ardenticatenales bacterium]|nr:DUF2029 domain-containing protein [Ardenticatenales bacterium]